MPKIVMYAGQKVALLTQHSKERVIAPVLEPVLGCVIEHMTGFDTDLFGTFTRETPRLKPLGVRLAKAWSFRFASRYGQ